MSDGLRVRTVKVYFPLFLRDAVKARREKLGIGTRAAASQSGVSPNTFNRVERGEMPDARTLIKLSIWAMQRGGRRK